MSLTRLVCGPLCCLGCILPIDFACADPPSKAVGVREKNKAGIDPGRRWAFLVGINDYVNQPKLKYCRQDCMSLRDTLVDRGRFEADNIVILTDDSKLDRDRPTFGQIYGRLPQVLEAADPEDLVLVFLSGHGAQFEDKQGKHGYFLPLDGSRRQTSIPLAWVTEQLESCKARSKVLILDACRNDVTEAGRATRSLEGSIVDESQGKSFVTLFSCDAGQKSSEHDESSNGVYTHFLLEGLAGAGDRDGDKNVDLYEAHLYARRKTQQWGVKHARPQSPMLKGEIGDAITLTFVPPTLPEVVQTPPRKPAQQPAARPKPPEQPVVRPKPSGPRQIVAVDIHASCDPNLLEVGTNTTFTISITGIGNAAATNVLVSCEFPNEMQFVSSGGATPGSCTGRRVTFTSLPSLAPNAKAEWTVTAKGMVSADVRTKVFETHDGRTTPDERVIRTQIINLD